jgi:hypothetical protein
MLVHTRYHIISLLCHRMVAAALFLRPRSLARHLLAQRVSLTLDPCLVVVAMSSPRVACIVLIALCMAVCVAGRNIIEEPSTGIENDGPSHACSRRRRLSCAMNTRSLVRLLSWHVCAVASAQFTALQDYVAEPDSNYAWSEANARRRPAHHEFMRAHARL